MSIWEQAQGRILRNGRCIHRAPPGSRIKFLVTHPGEPVAIVVGPEHEPYYVMRNGNRWTNVPVNFAEIEAARAAARP